MLRLYCLAYRVTPTVLCGAFPHGSVCVCSSSDSERVSGSADLYNYG